MSIIYSLPLPNMHRLETIIYMTHEHYVCSSITSKAHPILYIIHYLIYLLTHCHLEFFAGLAAYNDSAYLILVPKVEMCVSILYTFVSIVN